MGTISFVRTADGAFAAGTAALSLLTLTGLRQGPE